MASPIPLARLRARERFAARVAAAGAELHAAPQVTTLQVNVGKRCNQACRHCHVDAGPKRTEIMAPAVAERVIALLGASRGVARVDITGGAPELCPSFRRLVEAARRLDLEVIDRCNLTVLFEDGMDDLAEFLASRRVHLIASLPCYSADNVDRQRGRGVFETSIAALRKLNALGYGRGPLALDLVYNPAGPTLPPAQAALEARYKAELGQSFGVHFDRLLTLANVPIARFARDLERAGTADDYRRLLRDSFNPATVEGLMCRSHISVSHDGRLFDCDFNQMLELPLAASARTLWDIDSFDQLGGRAIATADHCFACTAGAGSSCGGALA